MGLTSNKAKLVDAFRLAVQGSEGRIWEIRQLTHAINKHTGYFKITTKHIRFIIKFQKYFRVFKSAGNENTSYIFIPRFKSKEREI